jgi:hypothetical protein
MRRLVDHVVALREAWIEVDNSENTPLPSVPKAATSPFPSQPMAGSSSTAKSSWKI